MLSLTILVFIQQHFALLIQGEVSLLQESQLAQKDLLKIKPITKKNDHKIVVKAKVNDYRSVNNLKALDPKKIETALETFYTDPNTDRYSHFVSLPPQIEVPKDVYNLWTPYPYIMKFNHGEYEVCKNPDDNIVYCHRKELLAKGDEGLLDYLMCLRAFKHKYPHKKSQVCLVILGEQGTGKGIYSSLEKSIYGNKYKGQRGIRIERVKSRKRIGQTNW